MYCLGEVPVPQWASQDERPTCTWRRWTSAGKRRAAEVPPIDPTGNQEDNKLASMHVGDQREGGEQWVLARTLSRVIAIGLQAA